ncbi:MAG TPA: CGNR zinc finger domain-containing protein [Mycobacteriales bacterium]|nr:CGNR zinc finger domain-containing protein [Mycobacteriales bacterium]
MDLANEDFLLALLNSTPIVEGEQQDTLDRAWLRAHGQVGSTEVVREVRTALQEVVRERQPADTLAPFLDDVSYRPQLTREGVHWELDAPADRRAAAHAVLAWDTLRRTRPGRLRPCENPECALFLIDRSKPNKARWCSMAVCGNRMKARRHYERTRSNAGG